MALTKATQNVITPNIVTTDTTQTITGIKTISVNSASTALTITQTGSGEAFRVEDSASPDASPFTISNNGTVQFQTGRGIPVAASSSATAYRQQNNGVYTMQFRFSTNTPNTVESFLLNDFIQFGFSPSSIFEVYVNPTISITDNTGAYILYAGAYTTATSGSINLLNDGATSFKVNGVTTANNFTTALFTGSAITVGGVPASGYASIQGGTGWTVTLRGHTTADTASAQYQTLLNVTLVSRNIL
jgi:hypothetical protein